MNFNSINSESTYNTSVQYAAKEVLEETYNDYINDLDTADEADGDDLNEVLTERLNEYVDNALIYYYSHDIVCNYTSNDEAYENVGMELKGSVQEIKSTVAYWALEQDLREAIDELDIESKIEELNELKEELNDINEKLGELETALQDLELELDRHQIQMTTARIEELETKQEELENKLGAFDFMDGL